MRRLTAQTLDTVRALVDRDGRRAEAGLRTIMDAGPQAVYAACCLWAELVRQLALPRRRPGMFYTWQMVDEVSGQAVCPDGLGAAMHAPVWATRFVMAVANHDQDMAAALLAADVEDPDRWWDDVVYLLAMAATAVRIRLEAVGRG